METMKMILRTIGSTASSVSKSSPWLLRGNDMEKCKQEYMEEGADGYTERTTCGGEMVVKKRAKTVMHGPNSIDVISGTEMRQCAKCKDIQFV